MIELTGHYKSNKKNTLLINNIVSKIELHEVKCRWEEIDNNYVQIITRNNAAKCHKISDTYSHLFKPIIDDLI